MVLISNTTYELCLQIKHGKYFLMNTSAFKYCNTVLIHNLFTWDDKGQVCNNSLHNLFSINLNKRQQK